MIYTISQIAQELNLSQSAIRFYDKCGLLPTVLRAQGGRRLFSENDMEQIRLIEALKTAGFSIEEMTAYFSKKQSAQSKLELLDKKAAQLEQALAAIKVEQARFNHPAPQVPSSLAVEKSENKRKPIIKIKSR